jgi:hypothetical protein
VVELLHARGHGRDVRVVASDSDCDPFLRCPFVVVAAVVVEERLTLLVLALDRV